MSLLSNTAGGSRGCCLVIVHAPDVMTIGRRAVLAPAASPVTVGRGAGSDFVLADEGVAERHAWLSHRAGAWWVQTVEPSLEAWVDDVPVHAQPRGVALAPDATLWLGRTMLRVVAADASHDAAYHQVIYELVTTDALTGLANRRSAAERLEREALRGGDGAAAQPLWVITLEIADLAALRARVGDALGDQVVRAVGRRLHHGATDAALVAARLGAGGTFVLVRRGGTEADARAFADALAAAAGDPPIACRGAQLRVSLATRVRACADWQAARAALVEPLVPTPIAAAAPTSAAAP